MPIKGSNALEGERVTACINSGIVIKTSYAGRPFELATELYDKPCFYSQQSGRTVKLKLEA
jgi:hypothetical protein